MWYLWLIFAILFVLIPIGVIKLKQISKKRSIQITKEQEKYANLVAFKLILIYWLCDLFFMSFIIDSLVCKFIFGGLIMLIIFYNLSNVFVKRRKNNFGSFTKWTMLQDFLIGVGLSIYLIYIIPNNDLREIVSIIIAAIYGGLLTLIGVAWTIQQSVIQKHEDELVRAKPLFTFNIFAENRPKVNNRKICLVQNNDEPNSFSEAMKLPKGVESYMEVENSAQSSFTIKRFYYDGEWHNVSANNVVLPNNRLLIQLFRKDTVTHPIMEIEDIFQRKYYYDLSFIFLFVYNTATLNEIKEITEQEVLSRNIKINEESANE